VVGEWSWEDQVNNEIKELIIQCFDDAFKDGTEALENSRRTNFLQDKLEKTQNVVSMLKNQIFSPPELSSVNLDSESFKRSSFSMRDDRYILPVEQRDQNMINQRVYHGLDDKSKKCLLCLSVFARVYVYIYPINQGLWMPEDQRRGNFYIASWIGRRAVGEEWRAALQLNNMMRWFRISDAVMENEMEKEMRWFRFEIFVWRWSEMEWRQWEGFWYLIHFNLMIA
jgi:hypothetical protein